MNHVIFAVAAFTASAAPIAAQAQSSVDQLAIQTLKEPLSPSAYSWERGSPPTVMVSASSHICLLTSVSGKFEGPGERIALYIDTGASGGAKWVLNGTSGQAQLRANATCVRKSKFVVPPGFMSSVFAKVHGNHMNGSCNPATNQMPGAPGASALFITGMSGKFKGGGESISVLGNNALQVRACSGNVDGTLVGLQSFKVPLAKYRTQASRTTAVGPATFVLSDSSEAPGFFDFAGPPFKVGPDNRWMVPVDEAVCGLVRIRGKFQGYGEYAQIVPLKGPEGRLWWTLQVSNQAESGIVDAAARCYARDQR